MTVVTESALERIRQRRKAAAETTTTDMPIPGFGGELVARYRIIDPLVEGKEIGQRIAQQFPKQDQLSEATHYANVDMLIAACVGFYVKHPATGQLAPFGDTSPDHAGLAPTYEDEALAELMGFEASSARECVVGVFGGHRAAVNVHAQLLQAWMANPTGDGSVL
jgi:hypothetical protein